MERHCHPRCCVRFIFGRCYWRFAGEKMNEIALKRQLLEQTNAVVKTRDAEQSLIALAQMIGTLGDLLSVWTGEVVRVRITAEGQPDKLDMIKHPPSANAKH